MVIDTLDGILNTLLDVPENQSVKKKVVAVAAAQDLHVLESVNLARERRIADFVLFGDGQGIKSACAELNIDPADFLIEHTGSHEESAEKAVALAASGGADAIMKGILETSTIIKAALNNADIRTGRRFSHMGMFILSAYHKPLYVTDAAVNIAPDLALKKEIIQNAVLAVQSLGVPMPKVALLCAKEKSDPKMPVTLEYDELVRQNIRGEIEGCVLDGPLALDGAVSKEAAEIKGITTPVAGDADILFCPNIEAGNILYKSLTMFTNAQVGGILLGARKPIILTSRSDTSATKLLSIAMGAVITAVINEKG